MNKRKRSLDSNEYTTLKSIKTNSDIDSLAFLISDISLDTDTIDTDTSIQKKRTLPPYFYKMDLYSEDELESELETELVSEKESELESETESNMDSLFETIETQSTYTESESDTESESEPQIFYSENEVVSDIDSEMDYDIDSEIVTKFTKMEL